MIKKLKTATFSILPIVAFVLIIHFFVGSVNTGVLVNFLIGSVILIIGQSVFLTGIENSIEPMGEFVGGSVSTNKRFYIFIIFGLIFGVFSTIAEPDMQVFASKVIIMGFGFNKFAFLLVAGLGVGAFISISLLRIVTKFSLNLLLFISYAIVFVLAIFNSETAFGVGLDAGANTTGVVTSPFLLALGVGVARLTSSRQAADDSFGLIALSSVGPVIAVLILNLLTGDVSQDVASVTSSNAMDSGVLSMVLEVFIDVAFSIIPLIIVFFVFEALFIKISKQEKKKLLFGSFITMVGFFLFLFGIEFGLTDMGEAIGVALGKTENILLIMFVTSLLGFFVVFSEPSIRVLSTQIEDVTNRNISSKVVMVATGLAIMLASIFVVLRIYFDISLWWFAGVVYGLAFVLSLFVPKLFTAIAFDSSGVATGTITVAFIFPIMIGLSGGGLNGFGTIAILTMVPCLVMEILGLVYAIQVKVDRRVAKKILLSLSKTEDKFSNIKNLKKRHEELYERF